MPDVGCKMEKQDMLRKAQYFNNVSDAESQKYQIHEFGYLLGADQLFLGLEPSCLGPKRPCLGPDPSQVCSLVRFS